LCLVVFDCTFNVWNHRVSDLLASRPAGFGKGHACLQWPSKAPYLIIPFTVDMDTNEQVVDLRTEIEVFISRSMCEATFHFIPFTTRSMETK